MYKTRTVLLSSLCFALTLGIVFIEPAFAAVSQWQDQGSNIYYSAGKVGIGTSTPDTKLEVNGSMTIANNKSFNFRDSNGDYDGTRLYRGSGGSLRVLYADSQFSVDSLENSGFAIRNSDLSNVFYIDPDGKSYFMNDGNIGIGTKNPTSNLEVSGGNFSSELKITADGDNSGGEGDQPVLTFSQDGGIKQSQVGYFDSNNHFTLKNNSSGSQLQLKDNGDVCLGVC